MDRPIELVPLVCLKCGTPIPANPDEVAWVCSQCGQGMALDPMQGLQPLEVKYAAIPNGRPGVPYWVCSGQVSLHRETYDGRQHGTKGDQEASQLWSQPRLFIIPAYTLPLESFLEKAISLLVRPPALQPGPAAVRFEPPTLMLEDIQPAAEFIVAAIEAGRKDRMKKLGFSINLELPTLWILPE